MRLTKLLTILALLVSPSAFAEDIWQSLKKGGYIILMRHADTSKQGNPTLLSHGKCKQERNLSTQGRQQAKSLGKLFKLKGVNVGQVYSSEYCRTRDTAILAFGKVRSLPQLNLIQGLRAKTADRMNSNITGKITTYKGKHNLVLITHRPNIEALTLEDIPKGGFLVLKPGADGEIEIVGQYKPN